MTNIAEILKNTPKGTKLYSPIFGECEFNHVSPCDSIYVCYKDTLIEFNKYGQFSLDNSDGECLLFPSKEVRDWNKYQLSHYNFKPFDRVVVRDNNGTWQIDFFYSFDPSTEFHYKGMVANWKQCLPFNEETAKLIGTTKDYEAL